MSSPAHSKAFQSQISIFDIVRNIPLSAVLKRYSPTEPIAKSGRLWLLCPFHQDKNPSISIKGGYWKCFGCGAGGDGVEFVSRLYKLPKVQAAKQIASAFGLSENQNLTREDRKRILAAQTERRTKKAFAAKVNKIYRQLCEVRIECCRIIDSTGKYGLPYSHIPDMLEMYLDILQFGTETEKKELLVSEEIRRWLALLPKIKKRRRL